VEAIKEASNIKLISTPGSNELHGNLLFLGYLFRSVIIAGDLTAQSKSAIEAKLSECIDLQSQQPAHGPLVTQALLWCIQGYTEYAGPTSSVVQRGLQLADRALARCSVPRPGAGLAGAAAADLLLSQKPTTETALRMPSWPFSLGYPNGRKSMEMFLPECSSWRQGQPQRWPRRCRWRRSMRSVERMR
jgi:hypothetical protein